MILSFSVLALLVVGTLSLFMAALNLAFWGFRQEEMAPLWLSGWLASGVVFSVCRLLQYAPLNDQAYSFLPRILLTAVYVMALAGYELANAFVAYHPRPRERAIVAVLVALPLVVLWSTNLVLTTQIVQRGMGLVGIFHGVAAGPLYAGANLLVAVVGAIAPVRLLLSTGPHTRENRLMAAGYLLVILLSTVDALAVVWNLPWIRLTDLSYLPLGVLFTYIELARTGRLYRDLDANVQHRTAELRAANEDLRAEIVERQHAQEALHVSEELYRVLFDANPHPSWVYDLGSLSFLLVNDAAVAHYGYSRDEFLHMTLEDIRPTEEVPALRKNVREHSEVLQWSGPWKHCKKDGSLISVEILSHALLFNGRPARLVMANDMTERLQTEAALRESEEKYRTLVENANDGIAIIQAGRVKYVNPRLAQMRGESIDHILGQRFDEYIHPDERAAIVGRHMRRAAGDLEPSTYEAALLRSDGSKALAELTTGPITYRGAPAEIVIVRDVSERRKTEQALQRQVREMTVLMTVAAACSESGYVDELIERVTETIGKALYPDNCGVLIADERLETWRPHPSYQGTVPEKIRRVYPVSHGIAGKVISEGRAIRVGDIRLESTYEEATPGIQSEVACPIVVNGRVFGCLNAESRVLEAFDEYDERLLSTIAGSMATAIERIHLLQMEKRRRQEAEILYNTTRDLVMERDISALLQVIVERAAGIVAAPSAALYLCEPEYRQVRCAVSYNTPRNLTGTIMKYGEGAAGTVADTGQPLIIEDYRTWEGRVEIYEDERPFISVLAVPMRWQGSVVGVLHVLDSTQVRSFTQEDLRMVSLFANQAALAVENARLFKETSQRAQEAGVIAAVGRDISKTLELDVTLERIAAHAKELLAARTCAVYVPDPGGATLGAIAALGPSAEEIKHAPLILGVGVLGSIALQRSGEIVNNIGNDPRAILIPGTEDLPVEHLMGVPVLTGDRFAGLIAAWRVGEGHEFNSGELQFLSSLAAQVGVAIENARLFESTRRRLSEIEGLHTVSTALRAARSLDEALPIILDQLMTLLNAQAASLEMVDTVSGEIVTTLARGAWASATGLRTPPGEGITAQVIATAQPYVQSGGAGMAPGSHPDLFAATGAAACVPVIAQHQPIGVLWIGRQTTVHAEETNLLAAIGEMVGNAIHRMQLNEETEHRADEFEALYRSANGLSSQWDLQTLLDAVVTETMQLLHPSGSDLYLYDPERKELCIVVEKGGLAFLGTRIREDEGLAGRVFREQQPQIVRDYGTYEGRSAKFESVPIGAVVEVPLTFAGEKIGVLAAFETGESRRKYTDAEARLLSLFATQAAGAIRTARLLDELQTAGRNLAQAYDTTLEGWAKALELRDKETEGHSRRVTDLTIRLARRLGIPESELIHIRRGVLLHDIGKMGITDQLLRKTGPLTEDEWVEMRKHPSYAYDLLRPISYLHPALDIPYCHHERWNGSGYPRGLKGKRIPLAARIFAVVDVYDALLNDRPYRKAWPRRQVMDYLREQSGISFDPDIVDAFLSLLHDKRLPGPENLTLP
ncbi:MAG TPA: GAF domain-containing protein [Anaerolineales bacterium]